MPDFSGPSNGAFPSVSAVPTTFGGAFAPITFLIPGAIATPVLHNDGLVGIRLWLLQTAGPGNVSAQVQFADGNTAANAIDWQPLVPAFAILAGGIPSLNEYSLGSRLVRVLLTSNGAATIRYRLTGALT